MKPKYKRVLIKLSGEALAGEKHCGINYDVVIPIAKAIRECKNLGVEIGIVVGGGNFWRGRSNNNISRVSADHIGMLATVMNAVGLSEILESIGVETKVMTTISFPQIGETYLPKKAVHHMTKGRVVIFGYGTGSAFFTTDTAASLRSIEVGADVMLKATNIDGVYDSSPKENPSAVRYDEVTFDEVLSKNLKVMDSTAASMCRDNNMSVLVFNISDPNNLVKAVLGESIGTIVKV